MIEQVLKVLLTSVLVVSASEAAKRSPLFGALIASLPLTSLMAMIWLYADTGDPEKVAALARGIFWLLLPSLVLLLVFPLLLRKGYAFAPSLALSIALTAAAYFAMLALLKWAGISN
jgi:F0F1-type ATP synthase assembly protein I